MKVLFIILAMLCLNLEAYWKIEFNEHSKNIIDIESFSSAFNRWNNDGYKITIKTQGKMTDLKHIEIIYIRSLFNAKFLRVQLNDFFTPGTYLIVEVNEPIPYYKTEEAKLADEYMKNTFFSSFDLTDDMEYDPYEESKKALKEGLEKERRLLAKLEKRNQRKSSRSNPIIYKSVSPYEAEKTTTVAFETNDYASYLLAISMNQFNGGN